ncbi:MAG: hypothetical protein Q9208_007864 [Pyrenodesmia sp. 3 TL-2023]
MVTDIEEYTLTQGAVKTAMILDHESYVTFTLTGPTTYTTFYTRALKPGRPWQAYYPSDYQCCMNCFVYFPHVEVFYWPPPESEQICANSSETLVTAQAVLPTGAAKTAAATFNPLFSNSSQPGPASTVNAEGFTFVSPSVYVAFGDVSAGDACGLVGEKHTSITLGFAPGELHTVTRLGKDHYDTTLGTRAFDPKNVLCSPDFSVPKLFLQQDSLAGIETYRPRIQMPSALHNLDPAWKSCTVDDYEGVDPPRQLVPASGFEDDPVAITSESPVQQATPAATIPPLPANTGEGKPENENPNGSGGSTPGPSNDPPSDPPASDPPSGQDSPPADPDMPVIQDPPSLDSSTDPGDTDSAPPVAADPVEQPKPEVPDKQDPNASGDSNNGQAQPQPAQGGQAQGGQTQGGVVQGGQALEGQQSQGGQQAQGGQPQSQPGQSRPGQSRPGQAQPGQVQSGQQAQEEPAQGGPAQGGQQAQGGENQGAQEATSNPTQTKNGDDQTPNVPQEAQPPKPSQPAVVVQGQTITQGAAPVTIAGKPVTYSQGSLYMNGVAAPAPTVRNTPQSPPPGPQPKPEAAPVNLGGFKFTPIFQPAVQGKTENPAITKPVVIVQGQTVRQDAPPITINGNEVVYSAGSVRVGNTAVPVAPANGGQAPEPVSIQGMTFTSMAIPPPAANEGSPVISGNEARPVIIVKGQTVTENGPAATVNGKPVVYSGGAVFAGGTRVNVPTVPPGQPPTPMSVAGVRFTPQPMQTHGDGPVPAVVVAGHTLTEGAPAVSVNGAKLAYTSGSVYVNGKAAPVPTPAPQPAREENQPVVVGGLSFYAAPPASQQNRAPSAIATVAGKTVVQETGGAVAIDGTTLTPGSSPIVISGTPVSINPTALVIGSETLPLPTLPTAEAVATLAGLTVSQNAGGAVIVAGKTLVPGGPALTISGTRYTVASSALIAGSSTIPLPKPSGSPILYDSQGGSFTLASNGALIVQPGATISAGGPAVTISGTPFSLVTSAGNTLLVEGTRTLPLSGATITPPPLEIFSSTVTANADGAYVIGGETITPDGPAVTISGTRFSLGHNSGGVEVLVVGSSTSTVDARITSGGIGGNSTLPGTGALPTSAGGPTSSAGIGGDIIAGLSSGASSTISVIRSTVWGFMAVMMVTVGWP